MLSNLIFIQKSASNWINPKIEPSILVPKAEQHDPFVRKQRLSVIASRIIEGLCTHNTFYEYFHDNVVSFFSYIPLRRLTLMMQLLTTTLYPGLWSVFDNACIHYSEEICEFVHSYGYQGFFFFINPIYISVCSSKPVVNCIQEVNYI
jgi:hypothetical protein